jgi:hypothetical protein
MRLVLLVTAILTIAGPVEARGRHRHHQSWGSGWRNVWREHDAWREPPCDAGCQRFRQLTADLQRERRTPQHPRPPITHEWIHETLSGLRFSDDPTATLRGDLDDLWDCDQPLNVNLARIDSLRSATQNAWVLGEIEAYVAERSGR